jgi:transcriptional regulator with XRE-family HTH domain
MDSSSIGQRMAEQRKKIEYSQAKMAESLGISRSLIGQIETDKSNPNLELLSQFVRITNTSYSYIIDGIESATEEIPLLTIDDFLSILCHLLYPLEEIHSDVNDTRKLLRENKDQKLIPVIESSDSFKAIRDFIEKNDSKKMLDQKEAIKVLLQTRDDLARYEELLRQKVRNLYLEIKLSQH